MALVRVPILLTTIGISLITGCESAPTHTLPQSWMAERPESPLKRSPVAATPIAGGAQFSQKSSEVPGREPSVAHELGESTSGTPESHPTQPSASLAHLESNQPSAADERLDDGTVTPVNAFSDGPLTPPPAPASAEPGVESVPADEFGETLEQAWAVALSTDQKLEAARWNTSAAQRGLFAAKAERLPSSTVTTGYVANNKPLALVNPLAGVAPGLPQGIQFTERDFLNAGITVAQPLYTFGRIQSAIEAAGAGVTAAQAVEATTVLDTKLSVAEAYVSVLRARRAREVALAAETSLREHERTVQRQLEQGIVVKNDLLAVQVALAKAEQAVVDTTNTQSVAEAAYNRALGRPLDSPVQIQDVTERGESRGLDVLTASALRLRPEVAGLSAQVRALRNQADSLRAAQHPQLALLGSYNYAENRFFVNEDIASVSVVGTWNVFDSGRIRHQSARLAQSAEGVIRARTDVETLISLQVRQAWLDLDSARKRIEVNRQALSSADENVKVTRNRYQEGTVTNTVVLDAVTLRTNAYSLYYDSIYAAVLAEMRLRRAVGDL